MGENGVVRLPAAGSLDPGAQEFRPAYSARQHQLPFVYPTYQPEMIYPFPPPPPPAAYVSPPPPPPPASLPPPATTPTRAVILSAVPPEVSESAVRRELEVFGDVRAVQMERVREGIVTVHFYDLRAAHAAFNAVRDQHMQHQNRLRLHFSYCSSLFAPSPPPPPPAPAPGIVAGHAVWAQFTIPATNAFPDGHNQGTLVVFNLDPAVSPSYTLKDIFQPFGAVKEVRETPMKRHQRFVEFYDVRDAARAMAEMNGKEINGRTMMIEFSRPGGNHCNRKHLNLMNNNSNNNFNLNLNLNLSPLSNFQHPINITKPFSLPPPPPPARASPASSLHHRRTSPRQSSRRRRSPPSSEESLEIALSSLRLEEHKSGSTGRNAMEEEREKSRKNVNMNGNCSTANCTPRMEGKNSGKPWKGGKQKKNFDPRFMIKEESILIIEGKKDSRTTVMIKNIPNKYSQKLLLNMLDNHCIHCNEQIGNAGGDQPFSSYDFVYLPIDFNNKCNVGYGFVNMTSPEAALRLHKAFHHQHWEVFNSRKICEVTYARVQGLEALKEHFKNSKFACENDEYLPVVFSPPRDGRRLTAPLPIVFSCTAPSLTLHSHHDQVPHDEIDGGEFSSTSTTPTTVPSSLDCFDHHDDHDHDSTVDGGDHIFNNASNGGGANYQCQ